MTGDFKPSGSAVIEFHPEAFSVKGKKLMGRNSAGNGFLEAYFRYSTDPKHRIWVEDRAHAVEFSNLAKGCRSTKPIHIYGKERGHLIEEAGTIFHAAPGLAQHAFQRSLYGADRWSICGVTHTLLSDRVMDAIAAMVTAPVEEWDAVVCTSSVARSLVEGVFEAECERLRERLGAKKFPRPLIEIIPLGVHCDRFGSNQIQKKEARDRFGIAEDEIAVLFVGRLSFHAKAHPAAMDMALANAARNRKVVIVEYGIFPNEPIAKAFEETARALAPGIRRIVLDGSNHDIANEAWACADVFCSLSDNHQETFGLTPLEAMAVGLPVVVSDWNGYRDTVRDGIDGFRIRTTAPHSDFGTDLVRQYASGVLNYDYYCGILSQFVGVDIDEATKAFEALFASPELRQKMGEAGRARAMSEFDWSVVYPKYEKLWKELAERRRAASSGNPAGKVASPWPARANPFSVFASFPSVLIDQHSRIYSTNRCHASHIDTCRKLASFSLVNPLLPTTNVIAEILSKIPAAGIVISELSAIVPVEQASNFIQILAWCAKIGAVRVDPARESAPQ